MDIFIKKIDKKTLWLISAVLVFQAGVFIAAAFITTPYYRTDDENTLAAIVLGLYGEKDTHMVFMHTLWGKLIQALSLFGNIINWYTLVEYILLFVSFSAILIVLAKDTETVHSIISIALVGVVMNYDFQHSLLFTQTAGVVTIAGLLLLVDAIEKRKNRKRMFIFGAVLLLMGSMYRFEGYGMILVIAFWWVLVRFVRHIREKDWKPVKQYLFWFGMPIVLSVILYAGDQMLYQKDADWKLYYEYNNLRSELLDYGFPSMVDNAELYEELGIEEIDYTNYVYWDFADTEKFTVDAMRQLVAAKEDKTLLQALKAGGYGVVKEFAFIWLVPLGLVVYFCFRKPDWLSLMAVITGGAVQELYFIYAGRAQLEYTTALIVLTMVTLLCYSSKEKEFRIESKWFRYIICAICCVSAVIILYSVYMRGLTQKYSRNQNVDRDEVTELIYGDTDNFYISKVGRGVVSFSDIWKPVQECEGKNATRLGDWLTMSPIVLKQWAAYGVENPYRALAEMENAYLVDSYTYEAKYKYILKNYNPDARMTLVKNIGGYNVYTFLEAQQDIAEKPYKESDGLLYDISFEEKGESKVLKGYMFEENTNSFRQKMYVNVRQDGETHIYQMTQVRNDNSSDVYNGKYAGFSYEYKDQDIICLYLENENGLYKVEL